MLCLLGTNAQYTDVLVIKPYKTIKQTQKLNCYCFSVLFVHRYALIIEKYLYGTNTCDHSRLLYMIINHKSFDMHVYEFIVI